MREPAPEGGTSGSTPSRTPAASPAVHRSRAATPTSVFSISVRSPSLNTGAMRREARAGLERVRVGEETIEDALLVLTELCTNAIAASPLTSMIDVAIDRIDGDTLLLSVSNTGPGFDPWSIRVPDETRSGGRGIAIARAIGDLDVTQSGRRTEVTVRVRTLR